MTRPEWQPIHTAPSWDRVMVCGWQPRSGTVAGYWWWHQDATGPDGKALAHPDASHWAPVILPENFPARDDRASPESIA